MKPQIFALSCLFLFQGSSALYEDPHCAAGRDTITHLFEWKWSDIKQECERFLGPYGYCAVQISPPTENAVITSPNRPWWERYRPVSYNLVSRSGNEADFRDMVNTCNQHGVRIYADVVFNHMSGRGDSGTGTAGNQYDGHTYSYPAVPYGSNDFNQPTCDIDDYSNKINVRNCALLGLNDLALGHDYVRGKIADYLNKLVDIGVAGFRVDAAKHMWPGDLENVFSRLHDLPSGAFGSGKKPFIYQEVIDQHREPIKMEEYFNTGRVTNFIYGTKLSEIFLHHSNQAKWLKNWGSSWGMPNTNHMVVFLSDHDNQRGHGGGGAVITFREHKALKMASAFMLAHPYGFPRIMSSYSWVQNFQGGQDTNSWQGPPHNSDMSIRSPVIKSDMSCSGGWVCEHRWRQIYNMVAFRNIVSGTAVENWQSFGDYQIAFSRGNKGFIAINAASGIMDRNVITGLPAGTYCDVISGSYENGSCTGINVTVSVDGRAHVHLDGDSEDPVVAIHTDAKVGSAARRTT